MRDIAIMEAPGTDHVLIELLVDGRRVAERRLSRAQMLHDPKLGRWVGMGVQEILLQHRQEFIEDLFGSHTRDT